MPTSSHPYFSIKNDEIIDDDLYIHLLERLNVIEKKLERLNVIEATNKELMVTIKFSY